MEQKYNAKTFSFFLLLLVATQSIDAQHTSRHAYRQPDTLPLLCQNRFALLAENESETEDKLLPIVLVHGLTQNGASMADTKALLQKLAPGTEVYTPDLPGNAFDNCPYQIQFLAGYVNQTPALENGFNFVAHSMGGIIARGVIESGLLNYRAYSLITLASPHQGICGIPYTLSEIERLNALSEIEKLSHKKLSLEDPLYEVMYTEYMQHHSSIANIWNEPGQQEQYKKYNLYLPLENNEISHPDNENYRNRLLSLLKFIALAAEKDTVLKPLESARLDYYDSTGTKIVPLEELPDYITLGYNILAAKNRLKRYTVAGVDHSTIRTDENTLRTYVIPSLIHASQIES
jgi:pimeloyl-ACP methyl ester carboxylesterase